RGGRPALHGPAGRGARGGRDGAVARARAGPAAAGRLRCSCAGRRRIMSPARTPERQDATLQAKLDALTEATELGRDRVPETALAAAREVLDHAGRRRRLSAEHTVVGFFGATGSGKSSLFNA